MTVIPPITDPLGRYWDQPPVEEILVDDTHAVMTKKTFDQLLDYSQTQPTGVYDGKMWKAMGYHVYEREGRKVVRETGYRLCWFGPHEDPSKASIERRMILLTD